MSLESSAGNGNGENKKVATRPHHDDDEEQATNPPERPNRHPDPPATFESGAPSEQQRSTKFTKLNNQDEEVPNQTPLLPNFKDQVRENQAKGVVAGTGRASQFQSMADRHQQGRTSASQNEYPNFKDQVREQQERGVIAGGKGQTTNQIDHQPLSPETTRQNEGPNFKDQMREANRREKGAHGLRDAAPGGVHYKDQVREAGPPNPNENHGSPREEEVGSHQISAHLVPDEEEQHNMIKANAVQELIANAAQAEIVDESKLRKQRRRRLCCGLLLMIAILAGSIAGTVVAVKRRNRREVVPPCDVRVVLKCQTLDGQPCEEFLSRPASLSCLELFGIDADGKAPGEFFEGFPSLQFLYEPADCNASTHTQDTPCVQNDSPQTSNALVACYPSRSFYADTCPCCLRTPREQLVVTPSTVMNGNSFIVTDPGQSSELFPVIDCVVPGQTVTIDSSGRVGLNLSERFGSLHLVGCGEISCLKEVQFSLQVQNIGLETFALSDLEVSSNVDGLVDAIFRFEEILPGETSVDNVDVLLDTCTTATISWAVSAVASLLSANTTCSASSHLEIPIKKDTVNSTMPRKTSPEVGQNIVNNTEESECDLEVEARCVFQGNECITGISCEERFVDPCPTTASTVTFLVVGGSCEERDDLEIFTCRDYFGGPNTSIGSEYYLEVTNSIGEVFFEDSILVGNEFFLFDPTDPSGGLPVFEDYILSFAVYNTLGGVVIQEMTVHPSCFHSKNIFGRIGSIQLFEFSEPQRGIFSFSVGDVFQVQVEATGNDDVDLQTITLALARQNSPDSTDFVNFTEPIVLTNESFIIEFSVDRSFQQTFEVRYALTGDKSNGTKCRKSGSARFDVSPIELPNALV